MQKIGDKIPVNCLDNGKTIDGILHKISKDKIEVVIQNNIILQLVKKQNTSLFIGSKGGMEFSAVINKTK